MSDADAGQVSIDWTTAEVRDGTLRVRLSDAPPSGWRRRFRAVAARLGRAAEPWGAIDARKDRIEVRAIVEGREDELRHFLESVLLEANAHGEGTEVAVADEHPPSPDDRMTAAFRAFAPERDGDD